MSSWTLSYKYLHYFHIHYTTEHKEKKRERVDYCLQSFTKSVAKSFSLDSTVKKEAFSVEKNEQMVSK